MAEKTAALLPASKAHWSRRIRFTVPVYVAEINGSIRCMACDVTIGRTHAALTEHDALPWHAVRLLEWGFQIPAARAKEAAEQ